MGLLLLFIAVIAAVVIILKSGTHRKKWLTRPIYAKFKKYCRQCRTPNAMP